MRRTVSISLHLEEERGGHIVEIARPVAGDRADPARHGVDRLPEPTNVNVDAAN